MILVALAATPARAHEGVSPLAVTVHAGGLGIVVDARWRESAAFSARFDRDASGVLDDGEREALALHLGARAERAIAVAIDGAPVPLAVIAGPELAVLPGGAVEARVLLRAWRWRWRAATLAMAIDTGDPRHVTEVRIAGRIERASRGAPASVTLAPSLP